MRFWYRLLAVVLLIGIAPPAAAHQQEAPPPGVVNVLTLDCRGADLRDESTCKPLGGVPLTWFTLDPEMKRPYSSQIRSTAADGTDSVSYEHWEFFDIFYNRYSTWTDEPITALIPEFGTSLQPGDVVTFTFLFVELERAEPERVPITVRLLDCSESQELSAASCRPLSGMRFLSSYYGTDGTGAAIFHTGIEATWEGKLEAPAVWVLNFEVDLTCLEDFADFDLIPTTPTVKVLLLPGEPFTIDVFFVERDSPLATPIAERPDWKPGTPRAWPCEERPTPIPSPTAPFI